MARGYERIIAFDPLNQYKDKQQEFTFVTSSPKQLVEYVRKNFKGNWRILYVPTDGNLMQHWRAVGVVAYAAGNCLLLIDEVGLLCEGGKFKREAKNADPILGKIVHFGRHRKLHVIATSQVPTDIALRFRALCCEMRLFQIDEPAYLDYVSGRTGTKVTDRLPDLPKYAFVQWKDTGEILVVQPSGKGAKRWEKKSS